MLSLLKSRLLKLESTITPSPLKSKDSVQSIMTVPSKENSRPASVSENCQTLRSRSFKVMRHLINIVDVSHLNQQACTQSNLAMSRKQSAPTTVNGPKQPRKELKTSGSAISIQQMSSSQPVDRKEVMQSHIPHVATLPPPKTKAPHDSKSTSDCRSPRVFHPKRPRKDAKTLSQPKLLESPSHPPCEPTSDKIEMPRANQKMQNLASSPSRQPTDALVHDKVKKEVFQSDRLKKGSNRLDLLKLDPVFSDLLQPSGSDYVCFTTKLWTQIKNLPQASSSLIQQQTLGVWEWKEGTSKAKLYEYRVPTSETTIDMRRFKYIGWAWRGKMDQQPPRIQDLPEEIHQDCDTLRWYWFKNLWLLFYFD